MLRSILGITVIVFTGAAGWCQDTGAKLAFDVASIRVSAAGPNIRQAMRRDNIQITPDSLTMRGANLRALMRYAYHVMDYQITGPDWIGGQRFDLTAKSAAPVTEDQLRAMLQTLLADRFKLTFHRQTKELPAFLLEVGKNGPKFQESKTDGEPDVHPDQATMRVTVSRTPVSQLVDMLSQMLRAPVIDMTGLKGKYDITIDAAKYLADFQPGGPPPDPVSIISMGLQQELGLKLESKKTMLDLLVFDSAEKLPIEN